MAAFHANPRVVDNQSLCELFDYAENFLAMPPAATSPFPPCIFSDRHRHRISVSPKDITFWLLITDDALKENRFDLRTQDPVDELQVDFARDAILDITQKAIRPCQ